MRNDQIIFEKMGNDKGQRFLDSLSKDNFSTPFLDSLLATGTPQVWQHLEGAVLATSWLTLGKGGTGGTLCRDTGGKKKGN
ncbi:MAG: hypothetical protein HY073_03815 [Deltaproteobacteria bacterium]|nr:hypothetical protein [Deltaproteobacteria bacterium]